MSTPTIFLSAASLDLKHWRDTLHGAFSRAGFRVLTQDHSLGAAPGDVRRLLADTIAEADCVIHLAGMAYGSPAANPFPEDPSFQCSWTQFEYYHAHAGKKDVIAFVTAPDLSEPFEEKGETPEEKEHSRQLQLAHRRRVEKGDFGGTPLAHLPRTANETIPSQPKLLEAVAAAIGKLGKTDPAYDRVKSKLDLLASGQGKSRRLTLSTVAIILFGLCAIGWSLHHLTKQQHEISKSIEMANMTDRVFAAYQKRWNFYREKDRSLSNEEIDQLIRSDLPSILELDGKQIAGILDKEAPRLAASSDTPLEKILSALFVMGEYETLIDIGEKRLGDSSLSILQTMAKASHALYYQSHDKKFLEAAYRYYLGASAMTDEKENWVDFMVCIFMTEWIKQDLEKYSKADSLLRELSIEEKKLNPNYPRIAVLLKDIANIYSQTFRTDDAESFILRALDIDEKFYGKDHFEVAKDLNTIALVHFKKNRLKKAESDSRRSILILLKSRRQSSQPDAILIEFLTNYIGILSASGKDADEIVGKVLLNIGSEADWTEDEWKQYLGKALQQITASPGDAKSKSGMDAYQIGDYKKAAELWNEALILYQGKPEVSNSETLRTRMNIASCRIFLREPAPARDELQAVIQELDKAGTRDLLAARARHHLARALVALDRKTQAIAALREALAIYKDLPVDQQFPAQFKESEDLFKQLQP